MTYTTTCTATKHVTEHPTSALHYKPAGTDTGSTVRLVSVSELAEYCGGYRPSWTSIYGSVYDITDFIPSHPGGTVIRYAAGRDATCLFESYHSSKQVTKCLAYLKTRCTYIGELAEEYCSCKKEAAADLLEKAMSSDNKYSEQAVKASSQPESPTDTKQRSDAGRSSACATQHQQQPHMPTSARRHLLCHHSTARRCLPAARAQWRSPRLPGGINKVEAVVTLLPLHVG